MKKRTLAATILGIALFCVSSTCSSGEDSKGMDDINRLYGELKEDLGRVADPLFDFAMESLNKRGAFLPFGSILDKEGKVVLVAGTDGRDAASSEEILPLLHDALRKSGRDGASIVAACEWITIQPEGEKQSKAIKVLVEHSRGLTVAFYLPVHKPFLRKWRKGTIFVRPAPPEINAWQAR